MRVFFFATNFKLFIVVGVHGGTEAKIQLLYCLKYFCSAFYLHFSNLLLLLLLNWRTQRGGFVMKQEIIFVLEIN